MAREMYIVTIGIRHDCSGLVNYIDAFGSIRSDCQKICFAACKCVRRFSVVEKVQDYCDKLREDFDIQSLLVKHDKSKGLLIASHLRLCKHSLTVVLKVLSDSVPEGSSQRWSRVSGAQDQIK